MAVRVFTTKYVPATSARCSRLTVVGAGFSMWKPYDYELSAEGNHLALAKAVVNALHERENEGGTWCWVYSSNTTYTHVRVQNYNLYESRLEPAVVTRSRTA